MDFERWVDGYKVRVFPWIDGKHIYINVQYFEAGSSLEKPPKMDKTAFITDNEQGRNIIKNYLSTLVNYIARAEFDKDHRLYITAE